MPAPQFIFQFYSDLHSNVSNPGLWWRMWLGIHFSGRVHAFRSELYLGRSTRKIYVCLQQIIQPHKMLAAICQVYMNKRSKHKVPSQQDSTLSHAHSHTQLGKWPKPVNYWLRGGRHKNGDGVLLGEFIAWVFISMCISRMFPVHILPQSNSIQRIVSYLTRK